MLARARVRRFAPFCLHLAQSVCTALIIRRFGSVGNCTFSVHWCLHLSALVCTAAVVVQMVQAGGEMVVPHAFHGIGGAVGRLEQREIRSPYAVASSAITVQDGCAQVRVQMVV